FATALPPAKVAFLFENVHHSPHGHRRRRRGNRLDDLVHRRLAQREDGIHDLPLPAAQFGWLGHCVIPRKAFCLVATLSRPSSVKILTSRTPIAIGLRYFFNG